MCNVQHLVTNHTESQISQEQRAAQPSLFTGGWLHHVFIQKNALLTYILSTWFSSTSVLFSCTPFGAKSYKQACVASPAALFSSLVLLWMCITGDLVQKGVQEKRTEVLENNVDRMWVSNALKKFFFNVLMWSHPPVKGEGSTALHSWEIWLLVWFVTRCWTLHITTSPHHCAANHAVNCKNPTDLTRCDPHEYYQVNCSCSVSHRTTCYAYFVVIDNIQYTANLEHF